MLGIHDFYLFLATGLLLNVTPGLDTAFVIGQSIRHGRRGGVLAALGIGAGCFVHIGAAAIGLSALLMTSALAFTAVKWLGVCYLCYVGVRMLFARAEVGNEKKPAASSVRAIFWQGFLTNALNPKVALFFLAFLPQFIEAASPNKAAAFALLGLIFNFTGTCWLLFLALSASGASRWLRGNSTVKLWMDRTIGGMFIVIGIKLALSQRS